MLRILIDSFSVHSFCRFLLQLILGMNLGKWECTREMELYILMFINFQRGLKVRWSEEGSAGFQTLWCICYLSFFNSSLITSHWTSVFDEFCFSVIHSFFICSLLQSLTRCYWGYCFENVATVDTQRADGEGIHHVDANVEFCSVLKTKLGAHRILMGAEMDCYDTTNDGRKFYIELKTTREVTNFFLVIFFCYVFPFL